MPVPIFPLLGAAARALGAKALAQFSVRTAASSVGRGGFSLGGLAARIAPAAQAVDVAALAKQLGTPRPSQEQIETARTQQSIDSLKTSAMGAAKPLAAIASVGPAMFLTARAIEGFGASLLSAREHLAIFDARIATSFAEIRRQDITLGVRTATATGGTTQALADSFMALREDLQPIKEAVINIMNFAGTQLINIARVGMFLLEISGQLKFLELINELLKLWYGESDTAEVQENIKEQARILAQIRDKISEDKDGKPLTKEPRTRQAVGNPLDIVMDRGGP